MRRLWKQRFMRWTTYATIVITLIVSVASCNFGITSGGEVLA